LGFRGCQGSHWIVRDFAFGSEASGVLLVYWIVRSKINANVLGEGKCLDHHQSIHQVQFLYAAGCNSFLDHKGNSNRFTTT
jgi:hypothetical protein